jgi:WLM domain
MWVHVLLQGLRRYQKIRETLVHELTHMVWGDHDNNFKQLNSQLLREAAQLEWTSQPGRALRDDSMCCACSGKNVYRLDILFLLARFCIGQVALQAAMQRQRRTMPAYWDRRLSPQSIVWVIVQTLRRQVRRQLPQRCSALSRRRPLQQDKPQLAA